MVANILPTDSPLTLEIGSIAQNSTFLKHGHVVYQIKKSQMQQHGIKYFVRIPPTPDPHPLP